MDSLPNVLQFPAADHPAVPPSASKKKPSKKKRPPNTMPDGRKRVRLTIGKRPDGSPDIRNFTGATLAEAKKNRDDWIKARDAALAAEAAAATPTIASPVRPEYDPCQSVASWAAYWDRVYPHGSEKGQVNTSSIVRKIQESELGHTKLADVRQYDVQAFARSCVFSKSYTTKIKNTLGNIFEAALDNEMLDKNPCHKVVWENKGEVGHRAIEQWERDLIVNNWDAHPAGVGAMLMLFSGMRPEEARAFDAKNISDKFIHVRDSSYFNRSGQLVIKYGETKTVSGQRDIPIVPQLRDLFRHVGRKDGLIWVSANGSALSECAYNRNWDSFITALRCARLGVPKNKIGNYSGFRVDKLSDDDLAIWNSTLDISPYSLRHTFCTMLFEAELDLKRIQYLMGHNNIETTMKFYHHWSAALARRSEDRMDKYFAGMIVKPSPPVDPN